eukprot:6287288-Lingulodinium_polyedra.AAC.1
MQRTGLLSRWTPWSEEGPRTTSESARGPRSWCSHALQPMPRSGLWTMPSWLLGGLGCTFLQADHTAPHPESMLGGPTLLLHFDEGPTNMALVSWLSYSAGLRILPTRDIFHR